MRRAGGRARGHAQRHGAVVVAPGRRGRRVAQRPQAADSCWRWARTAASPRPWSPAARRSRGAAPRSIAREAVVAGRVAQADVDVQAARRPGRRSGLAMKVACSPSARAAALIARLSRNAWSAARSGSATWPRLISNWPGAYSDTALLAGRPWLRAIALQAREESVVRIERIEAVDRAADRSQHRQPCGAATRGRPSAVTRRRRAGRTRARARATGVRPSSSKRAATLCSSARGAAKNGRPSASPSPPSTCAPPSRQGTGAKVAGSIRQGRSASPCSHTSPEAATLAPVASMP